MNDLPLPTARDWMRSPRLSLRPGDDIFQAIDRLVSAGVPTAAVLEGHRLVGIFTEKDSIRVLSRLLYDESADAGTLGDHMSSEFTACTPDMDFFRVAELFLSCNFPALPVVEAMVERYEAAMEQGLGSHPKSAILKTYEEALGVRFENASDS